MTWRSKAAKAASSGGGAAHADLQVDQGNNPEKLLITDGRVRSAGHIPVAVIQHGKKYLEAFPEYGPRLERDWAKGRREWLAISSRSKLITATNIEHYIYVDQPDLAVKTIQRVTSEAARYSRTAR
jgi:hypothetical protein